MKSDHYPILALDISTNIAYGCLLQSPHSIFHGQGNAGVQQSNAVLPLLMSLLQDAGITWNDLKLLVLGQGPGSFTGLRIAAASIAGINSSLKLPIWGVSSLAITAMQADSLDELWVIEDARAQEMFLGYYKQGTALHADTCVAIEYFDMGMTATSLSYVSSSDLKLDTQKFTQVPFNYSRSQAMSRLIQQRIKTLDIASLSIIAEPIYLQRSQAERLLEHA